MASPPTTLQVRFCTTMLDYMFDYVSSSHCQITWVRSCPHRCRSTAQFPFLVSLPHEFTNSFTNSRSRTHEAHIPLSRMRRLLLAPRQRRVSPRVSHSNEYYLPARQLLLWYGCFSPTLTNSFSISIFVNLYLSLSLSYECASVDSSHSSFRCWCSLLGCHGPRRAVEVHLC